MTVMMLMTAVPDYVYYRKYSMIMLLIKLSYYCAQHAQQVQKEVWDKKWTMKNSCGCL